MQSVKMDELYQSGIETMIFICIILFIHMALKIHESHKTGGIKNAIKETIENLFLYFLLYFAFFNLFVPPSDTDDEISAGILFVAFGVCRIAKHMASKTY